ncbi:MAG TPA: FHA domain-containing protein [Pseudomonadales bacterium]|nr:FHA domain-containing protein [Pseudomonadales bacterium]
MELVVEVCDNSGHMHAHYRFNQTSIKIGRGYNNDIILRDPHVCAEHAVLEWEDGSWRAKNLATVNRTTLLRAGGKQPVELSARVGIHSGDALCVGTQQLFLFAPHHVVAKALPLDPSTPRLEKYASAWVAVPILAFISAIFFLSSYLSEYNVPKYDRLLLNSLELLGVPLIWASIWSLIGRIAVHKTRFFAHACFAGLFTLGAYLFSLFSDWLVFATNTTLPAELAEAAYLGVSASALIYFSQKMGTRLTKTARLIWSSSFAWSFVAMALLWSFVEQPEFKHVPEYEAVIQPPFMPREKSEKLDSFLQGTSAIFEVKQKAGEPKSALP